jgi:RNA polymerase sigma-70 factor (ECF subfamily)
MTSAALALPAADPDPPMADQLDDLTLRRAQQGDQAAWRRVIDTFHPRIHALVWRMCGVSRRARVDDLVQDTHVRVLRALIGFDPRGPASLSTWILTIATRVVLNDARRAAELGLPDEPVASPAPSPSAQLERARLGAAIADAVAALPPDQRAVLVLTEYEGLAQADIAAALDIEVGTVKSRLSRARAAVRATLSRRGVTP